jgi:hypothetical protein
MTSILRSMLLAAGLLAFLIAGAMAQQNNPSATGSTLKSTTPGNDAGSSATTSGPSGGATLKTETKGDTGKKAVDESRNSQPASGESTGPSGKQPK